MLLHGAIAVLLTLFIVLAPFYNALYYSTNYLFEMPVFAWLLVLAVPCLIGGALLYAKRDQGTKNDVIVIGAALLIPASALLSHFFSEASYASYASFLIRLMAALLFITAYIWSRSKLFAEFLLIVLMGSGYLLVLHGFLNIAGIVQFKDAILLSGPIDDLELRLNSVFQYANAYAAYLIALLLGSLYVIVHTSNKALRGAIAFMLVPIALSLLLTGSKGGLVVLMGGLTALLLCLNLYSQIRVLLLLTVSLAASILLMSPVMQLGVEIGSGTDQAGASFIMLLVIGPSLLVTGLSTFSNRLWTERLRQRVALLDNMRFSRYWLIAIPGLLGVLGVMLYVLIYLSFPQLIPDYVRNRLGNITSFSERFLFYKDSLRIFADHPATGIGGGAWGDVILHYKSAPYQSSQAHSFLFQSLSEYGLIGLLCLLALIGYVFITFIRRGGIAPLSQGTRPGTVFFLIAFTLLLHSLIDFTMTYVYLLLLVFICLGAMLASAAAPRPSGSASSAVTRGWLGFCSLLLIALSLFAAQQTAGLVRGNDAFRKALDTDEAAKDPAKTWAVLQPALARSYTNPHYAMFGNSLLVQQYSQSGNNAYFEQADAALQALRREEPYSFAVREQQYHFYMSKGDWEGAFSFVEGQLDMYPWDIQLYENIVQTAYRLGAMRKETGELGQMDLWWNRALDYYGEAAAKNESLHTINNTSHPSGIEFFPTDLMTYNAGIIYFSRGEYATAEATLKDKITYYPENETQKGVIRWYLASLLKQGKEDIALYNQLISIDIREKDLVAELAQR